jgi:DNA-binding MarR family transcriptional regulator
VDRKSDDEVLLDALRIAVGISVRAADELDDLSPVQLRALTVLQENPRANLARLAQAMSVTVSTASRLVDRLIAGGLATRKPSDRTRREVALGLTRAGRSALQRYDRLRLESLRACLAHVPPRITDDLLAALHEVVAVMPAVSESPRPA